MNIIECARELNVSPTTISHALSGQGRLSPATRERVLEQLQAIGYTPNCHAQRLVSGRSHLVAIDWVHEDSLTNFYQMQIAQALQHALRPHGYNLTFNLVSGAEEQNTILRQWARSRAVDGIISLGRLIDASEIRQEIARPESPCVVISTTAVRGEQYTASVVLSPRRGLQQAAKLLVEQGHRRVGYLGWDDHLLAGWRETLRTFKLSVAKHHIAVWGHDHPWYSLPDSETLERTKSFFRQMMAQPNPPTAILARTDVMALGVLQAAKSMGLSVPRDISIIGHDDIPLLPLADPPLTSLRLDYQETGRVAVEMLMELFKNPDVTLEPRTVEMELIERDSVGPAPHQGK